MCLEGRACPWMYFKLPKSEALVLLHSGEEGFEAFLSLPQISGGGWWWKLSISLPRRVSLFLIRLSLSD